MKQFVPVLVVLFLVAALLRNDFYFTILYLLAGLYILSRLWTSRAATQLAVKRHVAERAFLGDEIQVELTVRNQGLLPMPWVEINELLPVQLRIPPFVRQVFSLGPRETKGVTYLLKARRRGYHPVGPLQIRTGDLWGLFRNHLTEIPPEHLIVYPRVVPLQKLGLPTRSPLVALPAPSPLYEDPSRVLGVRQYQQGDSPRRIHWTASASAGQLLVKRYQPAIARDTLLCLDLNESHYQQGARFTATELAIVVVASLANHIIVNERLACGLVTVAKDPLRAGKHHSAPPRKERGHLMSLLEQLARVQVTDATPFAPVVRRESSRLGWGSTIVVISGSERETLFDTLHQLRRAGFATALILVQATAPSAGLKQRSSLLSIPLYHVWDEKEIAGWGELRSGAGEQR